MTFALLLLSLSNNLQAEGTKELAPNPNDVTMLYTCVSGFGSFAQYDGPESGRLYVRIEDPENEQLFLGFSRRAQTANGVDGVLANTDYYFRVKDPNGNVVYGPQLINNTTANADTWALANAGPAPIVGTGGYIPFTFDPSGLPSGDYYIEFSYNQNSATTTTLSIKYWDITVATNGGSPTAINGRVWSKNWAFRTPSISQGSDPNYTFFDRPFNGQVYLYTFDGFVSKIDFDNSGFQGLSFNLAYNESGVVSTGNVESDRRSVENSNSTFAEYQIFLNDPDILIYPSGNIGTVVTNPIVRDCDPSDLCVSYEVSEIGYVFILLDFDSTSGAGLYDQNTADVLLYEKVDTVGGASAPYTGCIPWDGLDGLGAPVPANTEIPVIMTYAQGMVHFPVYDVEYILNGFEVTPVRPLITGFTQRIYFDDTNIPDAPGNGNPKDMVNGCLPPCHDYTNFNYGDQNTINTWWFTNQDFVISIQESACNLDAYFDNANTTEGTPVVIDVTDNDVGDGLDPSSVSTTGLLQPTNGSISVNGSTGDITYTPVNGFIGIDTFDYQVCDSLGTPCDTATVFVTVTCGTATGNVISGTVFTDEDSNGIPGSGESGESGVTVILYEDNNGDGQVDGGDTQLTTVDTDANGNYSFTVSNALGATYTYEDVPSGGVPFGNASYPCTSGSELERDIVVSDNFIVDDVDFGFNMTHTWRGDIEVVIESPAGTTVTVINQDSNNDNNQNFDLLLDDSSGGNINDGNADNVATPYYGRSASPSNPLSAFQGENANGTWKVRMCDVFPDDNGTYNRAQLVITSAPRNFVVEIDTTDLPCGAAMVSDNVETAIFLAANSEDCANNFGFLPNTSVAVASSNSPICEGDDLNLQESGGDAVSWNWSGPNGFSSASQNPTRSASPLANAGNYTVTITDSNGCTAESNTILVTINQLVNAGTALASDTLCLNGSGLSFIDLFDKLNGEESGGTWTVIAGSPGSNFNSLTGVLNPNGLQEANYTFRYTVPGAPPCPDDTEEWTLVIERCCPPQICLPVTTTRNN